MKKIAVIGSGSWGVALSMHLATMGHIVKIWSFAQEEADLINKEKKCKFLPEVKIPDNVTCYTNFEEALEDTDLIIHVTPSKFVRNILKQYKHLVKNQPIVMQYFLVQVMQKKFQNKYRLQWLLHQKKKLYKRKFVQFL